jgi:hypothetical protein
MKELPSDFRFSFMKMMVEHEIKDINLAWEKAATLLNENGPKWKKSVQDEANRIHRSKFMTQFNKARGTIEDNAFKHGFEQGMLNGIENFQLWYYCNVCGERVNINPNSEVHKAIINLLKEKRWGHVECHDKAKKK